MSNFKIENIHCDINVVGVSNSTHIRVKTPTYNEIGELDGCDEQYLSFDTHGDELKDFINAIKKLEKHFTTSSTTKTTKKT